MSPTSLKVALIGHTGHLGRHILNALITSLDNGTISLVIFHRPSSDTSAVPSTVEKRLLDLDNVDPAQLKKHLADINVLISAVGSRQIAAQTHLIDALIGSKNLISFIPSEFGCHWTVEEYTTPQLSFLAGKQHVEDYAKEKGVPVTLVRTGVFDMVLGFPNGPSGINIQANSVEKYRGSLENQTHLSTLEYIGFALSHLVVTRPAELANKTFQLIEFSATGNEFLELLTRASGKQATITELSDEAWDEAFEKGGFGSLGLAIRRKWGNGDWSYDGERVAVEGWKGKTLEDVVRKYAMEPSA